MFCCLNDPVLSPLAAAFSMRSSEKGRFSVKDDVRTVRQVEEREE